MSHARLSHVGRSLAFGLSFAALLAAGAQAATENDGTRVGITGAVNPATTGTPPNTNSRLLTVGSDVVFREKITTTAEGQAQILFLDQSALMIGPNSEVTLDEFVYDPNTCKGNLVASLSQGAFRFIGGKLSKQGNATLRTPVATIGIRGSDVSVMFDAAKQVANVIATHGFASIETEAGKINLITGFMSTIAAGGASAPTRMTPEALTQANGAFEGQSGKSGGSSEPPTDQQVAGSGLSNTVQGAGLSAIEPGAGGNGGQSGGTGDTPGTVTETANDAATTGTQATPPPPPPPPTIGQTITGITGVHKQTTGDGTGNFGTRRDGGTLPFFNQPFFNSDNYGTFSGGTLTRFGDGSILAVVTDDVDGSNALLIAVPSGGTYQALVIAEEDAFASNQGALAGQSTDRLYVSPDNRFFAASLSTITTTDAPPVFTGDRLFVFGGTTVNAAELLTRTANPVLRTFRLMPDLLLDSNIPFIRREAGGALSNPVVSPLYMISPEGENAVSSRVLQGNLAISGQGAEQKSAVTLLIANVFQNEESGFNVALTGQMRGTARLAALPNGGAPGEAGPDIIRVSGAASSVPDGSGRSFFGASTADYFVIDENGYPSEFSGGGGRQNFSAFEGYFHTPANDERYGFNHVAVRDPGTGALGARTDQVLTGYVGGFGETRTGTGGLAFSGPYVITNSDPSGVVVETMPTLNNNRIGATLTFKGGADDFVLLFGHNSESTVGARSTFIDDDRFGATQRAATEGVTINGVPEEANAVVNGSAAASIT